MFHRLKSAIKRTLVLPGVRAPFRWLVRDHAIIFMLHRFTDEANGIRGMDPNVLREMLKRIREQDLRVISLEQLFEDLSSGKPVTGSVAFTIDDGYAHDLALASSLFAEFQFPITAFLTTSAVDGKIWFWWDQIEYLLERSKMNRVEVVCSCRKINGDLSTPAARLHSQQSLVSLCKDIPETDKLALIKDLAHTLEVILPAKAPQKYRPITWEEVGACEAKACASARTP